VPRVPAALLAGCLTAALLISGAAPTLAAPPPAPAFGPQIDDYARHEPQRECLTVEQPGVVDFRRMLQAAYGANGAGILRGCAVGGTSEHKEGRAYDWMLDANRTADRAKADELLSWLLATDEYGNRHAMARRLGITYIIWDRQMWAVWRPNDGWQPYTGASPHTDHIHFSFGWAGARQQTSWWTAGGTRRAFTDVPSSSYFAEPVNWMVGHGITDGYGSTGEFRPHTGVTRAQMAAFLWRMMDQPTGHPPHGFPDVPAGSYYDEAVRWLKSADITQGVGNTGRFEPNRVVTRGEMAAFLWRTVNRPSGDLPHGFPDVSSSNYYDAAVSWMVAHRITDGFGTTGRFEPGREVTRAQTSAFMFRLASARDAWRATTSQPSTVRF
jgi:hypothetical protein